MNIQNVFLWVKTVKFCVIQVILTPATVVYFDNPQEPDPEDWGLHWATRYIDTRRTFFFAPDSLYDNIDFEFFGKRISRQQMCGTKIRCPQLKSPQNIIGRLRFMMLLNSIRRECLSVSLSVMVCYSVFSLLHSIGGRKHFSQRMWSLPDTFAREPQLSDYILTTLMLGLGLTLILLASLPLSTIAWCFVFS